MHRRVAPQSCFVLRRSVRPERLRHRFPTVRSRLYQHQILQPNTNFQSLPAEPYRLDSNGSPFLLPSWGSIVHNVSIGDSAFGWEADCIHPGVSIKYPNEAGNRGLNILSCVGNDATIMSGEAKNAKGIVTGKSGRFSEQVIVHFPKKIREKISINDKILIKSLGVKH